MFATEIRHNLRPNRSSSHHQERARCAGQSLQDHSQLVRSRQRDLVCTKRLILRPPYQSCRPPTTALGAEMAARGCPCRERSGLVTLTTISVRAEPALFRHLQPNTTEPPPCAATRYCIGASNARQLSRSQRRQLEICQQPSPTRGGHDVRVEACHSGCCHSRRFWR